MWNLDEAGVTTVQRHKNVVSEKGLKQVGLVTSAKCGILVTICCCVVLMDKQLLRVCLYLFIGRYTQLEALY